MFLFVSAAFIPRKQFEAQRPFLVQGRSKKAFFNKKVK